MWETVPPWGGKAGHSSPGEREVPYSIDASNGEREEGGGSGKNSRGAIESNEFKKTLADESTGRGKNLFRVTAS